MKSNGQPSGTFAQYRSVLDDLPPDIVITDVHAHCHDLSLCSYIGLIQNEAQQSRIGTIINNGTGDDWTQLLALGTVSPLFRSALAIHPWFIDERWQGKIESLASLAKSTPLAALGECGLDRRMQKVPLQKQIEVFEAHLSLARDLALPVITHNVGALNELYHSLMRMKMSDHPVIIHGFCGSKESLDLFSRCNVVFSLNARIAASRNPQRLRMLQALIKSGRLLLESDAPHMHPLGKNSGPNLPSCILYTLRTLQEMTGIRPVEILRKTVMQAKNVFLNEDR